jgi:hypothetical protein
LPSGLPAIYVANEWSRLTTEPAPPAGYFLAAAGKVYSTYSPVPGGGPSRLIETGSDVVRIIVQDADAGLGHVQASAVSGPEPGGAVVLLEREPGSPVRFNGYLRLLAGDAADSDSDSLSPGDMAARLRVRSTSVTIAYAPAAGGTPVTATVDIDVSPPVVAVVTPQHGAVTNLRVPRISGAVTDAASSGLKLVQQSSSAGPAGPGPSFAIYIDRSEDAGNALPVVAEAGHPAPGVTAEPITPPEWSDGQGILAFDYVPSDALPSPAVAFPDHLVDFQVRVSDLAGNIGFSDSDQGAAGTVAGSYSAHAIRIDTLPPVPLVNPAGCSPITPAPSAAVVCPNATGKVLDPASGGDSPLEVSRRSVKATFDSPVQVTDSSQVAATFAGGVHAPVSADAFGATVYFAFAGDIPSADTPALTVTGGITDAAGNEVTAVTIATADGIPPVLTVTFTGGSGRGPSFEEGPTRLTARRMLVGVGSDEPLAGPASVEVHAVVGCGAVPERAGLTVAGGFMEYIAPILARPGPRPLMVEGADVQGNRAVLNSGCGPDVAFTLDNLFAGPPHFTPAQGAVVFEPRPQITVDFSAAGETSSVSVNRLLIDGVDVTGAISSPGWSTVLTVTPAEDLAPGFHTVEVPIHGATDAAGNQNSTEMSATFTIATIAASPTVPAQATPTAVVTPTVTVPGTGTPPASPGPGGGPPTQPPTATPASRLPGAPRNVRTVAGNSVVTVSWDRPADAGSSAISSYDVIVIPTGRYVTVPGNVESITMTGLVNGTAYSFAVQANNSAGAGPPSPITEAVVPAGPPGPPLSVVAQATGDDEVTVTWRPPLTSNGRPVTAYIVSVDPPVAPRQDVGLEVTKATFTGLPAAVRLTFRVQAVSQAGEGPMSAASGPVVVRGRAAPDAETPAPGPTTPRSVISTALQLDAAARQSVNDALRSATGRTLTLGGGPALISVVSGRLRLTFPLNGSESGLLPARPVQFTAGPITVESTSDSVRVSVQFAPDLRLEANGDIRFLSRSLAIDLVDPALTYAPARQEGASGPLVMFSVDVVSLRDGMELAAIYSDSFRDTLAAVVDRLREHGPGAPLYIEDPSADVAVVVAVWRSGPDGGPLGDNTVTFALADSWVESTVQRSQELLAVKVGSGGEVFFVPAGCALPVAGKVTCQAVFTGAAGGFSTFGLIAASRIPAQAVQPSAAVEAQVVPANPVLEPTQAPDAGNATPLPDAEPPGPAPAVVTAEAPGLLTPAARHPDASATATAGTGPAHTRSPDTVAAAAAAPRPSPVVSGETISPVSPFEPVDQLPASGPRVWLAVVITVASLAVLSGAFAIGRAISQRQSGASRPG